MSKRYVPENSKEFTFLDGLITVYTYTNKEGEICAIAYKGKSNKALFCNRFHNERQRKNKIFSTVTQYNAEFLRKKEDQENKQSFINSIKVDDIFYSSWGYEQTNVCFYQVVEKKGSKVIFKKIGQKYDYTSDMSGKTTPNLNDFIEDEKYTKIIRSTYLKINDCEYINKYDNEPKSFSKYA